MKITVRPETGTTYHSISIVSESKEIYMIIIGQGNIWSQLAIHDRPLQVYKDTTITDSPSIWRP